MTRFTREQEKEFEAKREEVKKLKEQIMDLIHPSREYKCYFIEYFPDFNTTEGKNKIRATWTGSTTSDDVIHAMKYVLEKLKSKYGKV